MATQYAQSVASIRDEGGKICGAGWLALSRYVVTCAHVVNDALNREAQAAPAPEGIVWVDLPFLGKRGLGARIVAWFPMLP